jgi:hypothetical protein
LVHAGKLPQKKPIALFHHGHSGLLQHDFRKQDAVRIGLTPPGQLALFTVKPSQQALAKAVAGRCVKRLSW